MSEEGPEAPEGRHPLGLQTFFKPPHPSLRGSGRRSRKQKERSSRKCLRNSVQKQPSASLGTPVSQQLLLPMHALDTWIVCRHEGDTCGQEGAICPCGNVRNTK
eukprot:1149468-Pelagomonas_calceolata.AAC.2